MFSKCHKSSVIFASNCFLTKGASGVTEKASTKKIYPQSNSFECDECGFSTKSLYELTGHMTVQHDAPNPRCCLYCNKCYPRDVDYLEHMNGVHSLPAWNIDSENLQDSGSLPTERAFGGALKTYEIAVGANDLDLLHVMHIKRQEVENIVRLSVQQHSQKVQFSSKIQLTKPPKHDDEISRSMVNQIESQCIYSQKWNM